MSGDRDGRASNEPATGFDLAATIRSVGLDRQRIALWVVTGLVVLGLWYFAWRFIGTLIVGLFVYYVTRPLFVRIHARIAGRTTAVVVSLLTVAVPTLLLISWTVAILVQSIVDFLGSDASDPLASIVQPYVDVSSELDSVEEVVQQVVADPRGFSGQVGPLVSGIADGIIGTVGVLGSVALQAFIVIVITFYLLRDDVHIAAWARRTFAAEGSIVETYLVRLDRDLQNIFFGNILNALATGLIAVVSFAILNVIAPDIVTIPQATLLGLLVGVASLVPAIGIKLVTWPLGFYLVARSLLFDPATIWFPVLFFAVTFVVVDYIPDQLLRPYVSGRSLHVGAVMLAYLFGPILFGWYGIFLGPFLLAVLYEFGLVVVPWLTHTEAGPSAPTDAAPVPIERDEAGDQPPDPPDADAPPEQSDAGVPPLDGGTEATEESPDDRS